MLGAIYLKASQLPLQTMKVDLEKSLLKGTKLDDTQDGVDLMEAHIFEKVTFKDVKRLYLHRDRTRKVRDPNTKLERDITPQEWDRIRSNCRLFSAKWGIEGIMNE